MKFTIVINNRMPLDEQNGLFCFVAWQSCLIEWTGGHVWHLTSHSDWLMKFVHAVFSIKFALEAISAVFRANRNSAAFAFAVNINNITQSSANAAVGFAFVFALSIKGPLQCIFIFIFIYFAAHRKSHLKVHTVHWNSENRRESSRSRKIFIFLCTWALIFIYNID
jgi:hypothetical protein